MNIYKNKLSLMCLLTTTMTAIAMEETEQQKRPLALENNQTHSIVAQLSKAAQEKNFDQYFKLLAKQPLEKQKELLHIPLGANGSKAIHFAAEIGNNEAIHSLVTSGIDVDEPNYEGMTPLIFALAAGKTETIRLLLQHGARLDAQDQHGNTALHYAVDCCHIPVISMLVNDYGMRPKTRAKDNRTALDYAAITNQVDALNALLCRNADVSTYNNALVNAAEWGKVDVIEALTKDYGVDPNCTDDLDGFTPLQAAAAKGHIAAIHALIKNGANKDIRTKGGGNTLSIAASFGHILACLSLIKDHGFNPNGEGSNGITVLHCAALEGQTDVINLLIKEGAFTGAVAPLTGVSVLHAAALASNPRALMTLIKKHGLDPNSITAEGATSFIIASTCLARCALLVGGAHVLAHEKASCCYADLVTESSKHMLTEALLLDPPSDQTLPIDPNLCYGTDNSTALMYAIKRACLPCIRTLLSDPRTDLNIQDSHGRTALHYLADSLHNEEMHRFCSVLLRKQRVNAGLKDKQGKTAYDLIKAAITKYDAATIEVYAYLFELRKMKVQLYLSLKNARCSEECQERLCTHRAHLPPDICLKIARLLTEDSLPVQVKNYGRTEPLPAPTIAGSAVLSQLYALYKSVLGQKQ